MADEKTPVDQQELKAQKPEPKQAEKPKPAAAPQAAVANPAEAKTPENKDNKKEAKSGPKKKGLERIYTIPLRKAFDYTRTKRARRAIKLIRQFALRHMKSSEVRLDPKVNEMVMSHGMQKIPRKLKVKLEKVGDVTTVTLNT